MRSSSRRPVGASPKTTNVRGSGFRRATGRADRIRRAHRIAGDDRRACAGARRGGVVGCARRRSRALGISHNVHYVNLLGLWVFRAPRRPPAGAVGTPGVAFCCRTQRFLPRASIARLERSTDACPGPNATACQPRVASRGRCCRPRVGRFGLPGTDVTDDGRPPCSARRIAAKHSVPGRGRVLSRRSLCVSQQNARRETLPFAAEVEKRS